MPHEAWPKMELNLLDERQDAPPSFPLDVLPPFWRTWTETATASTGAPADYVALSLLTAAGSLIPGRRVMPSPGWAEPCILWSALVGPPSCGKTPAVEAACGLVRGVWNQRWLEGQQEKARAGDVPLFTNATTIDAILEAMGQALPRGMLLVRDEQAGAHGARHARRHCPCVLGIGVVPARPGLRLARQDDGAGGAVTGDPRAAHPEALMPAVGLPCLSEEATSSGGTRPVIRVRSREGWGPTLRLRVAMALAPSAGTITVWDTLDLLDGRFQAFAEGVAEDRYAFWLGSGISFGRVDGLRKLVPRVIEFLRRQIVHGVPDCRFNKALNRALALALLSDEEKCRIDVTRPFSEWPDANAIFGRLIGNYARLLDIPVDSEVEDYLLWGGVDIVATFADSAIEPDVEHLCIGILILEGVSSDIASANWDGLVEKAVNMLAAGRPALVVCVRPEDLREPELRAHLFKFHGCAVKAAADETRFRSYLVGRQSQIHGWSARQENRAMVNRLIDVIATKPTVMMGLSAQDANIQAIFVEAEVRLAWPWPGARPSYVFSEDELGVDQDALLRNVYRAAYTPASRQQIMESALIRAYAKPLLVALVLHVLCTKLRKLIEIAPGVLDAAGRRHLQDGLIAMRNLLSAAAEPDRLPFVQMLVEQTSRAIMMFRDGHAHDAPRPYNPITSIPIHQIAGDMNLPASGLREAEIAIGILGVGAKDGVWTLHAVDVGDPSGGVVQINSAAGSAKVLFVVNSHAALRLRHHKHLIDSDDTMVIHSLETAPVLPRSPRGAPGRTGRLGPREVSIAELMGEAVTSAELIQRFREGLIL
jgi:hypothetical protein